MDLFLRRVRHPQALKNYRVLLKDDGLEVEIGSIGIQRGLTFFSHSNRPRRARFTAQGRSDTSCLPIRLASAIHLLPPPNGPPPAGVCLHGQFLPQQAQVTLIIAFHCRLNFID
jgi:hypothetical protein